MKTITMYLSPISKGCIFQMFFGDPGDRYFSPYVCQSHRSCGVYILLDWQGNPSSSPAIQRYL